MPILQERVSVSDDPGDAVQELPEIDLLQLSQLPPDDIADPGVIEQLRLKYRALAKRSLYFLAKAVLGFKDMTLFTHWEYCKFIQDLRNRREIDLLPRGCFKTSIGTIAFVIWLLINNPNYLILIANQSAGNAYRMLNEIEEHLDGRNAMMRWLFPEMIKPQARWEPWSNEHMTIPCRDIISGTPSVTACGVGKKIESWHFNVIIKDDLIGRKAMYSQLEMDEAISWNDYTDALFIDGERDLERTHGTRWKLNDLYRIMLDDPRYATFIRQAMEDDGTLFFPERLSANYLRQLRERNFLVFMSQYQNNPVSKENLDFDLNALRFYQLALNQKDDERFCEIDGGKFWVKDMSVGLFIDSASSGDVEMNAQQAMRRSVIRKANNAVLIVGLHPSGRYFLLDYWVGRGQGKNPELQLSEHILELAMRWSGYMKQGWLEAFGAEGAIITVFNMLCKERKFAFRIDKLPRGGVKSKQVRIRGAIGQAAGLGLLTVRKTHDVFIAEYTNYPESLTVDTLDAMTWAILTLKRPRPLVEEEYQKEQKEKFKERRLRMIGNAGY